ncbi:MAG: hypothetical protein H6839_03685 [Planctomycetes bacterium]|nr:hypothetical protein [Planctomycetota bacterium]
MAKLDFILPCQEVRMDEFNCLHVHRPLSCLHRSQANSEEYAEFGALFRLSECVPGQLPRVVSVVESSDGEEIGRVTQGAEYPLADVFGVAVGRLRVQHAPYDPIGLRFVALSEDTELGREWVPSCPYEPQELGVDVDLPE